MSSLPPRFPRHKLLDRAATLESAIAVQMDETNARLQELSEFGDNSRRAKFEARMVLLQAARDYVNQARTELWLLQ